MRFSVWWIFPVTACVCVLFILMAPPSKPCQKHIRKPGTTNQTVPFVVILAAARSGSTWLESFFTENVEVLDFFEPLDERAFKKYCFTLIMVCRDDISFRLGFEV
eukprot:sb/3477962/